MDSGVAATTNWNLTAGQSVTNVIQTKASKSENFVRPDLDELLFADRAILLSRADSTEANCEFTIRVFPKYKIDSLSIVCSSPKIEIFCKEQCEYVETIYGEILNDGNENFRYDFQILKSGVRHIMLKMLTNSNEVCIYGIQMNVAPNPDGISTLLQSNINLDNVKEMLNNSNQKLSPSAEKCKMFLETYKKSIGSGMSGANVNMLEQFKKSMLLGGEMGAGAASVQIDKDPNTTLLQNYIDARVQQAESRILERLDLFENAQNEKLNHILRLLESKAFGNKS